MHHKTPKQRTWENHVRSYVESLPRTFIETIHLFSAKGHRSSSNNVSFLEQQCTVNKRRPSLAVLKKYLAGTSLKLFHPPNIAPNGAAKGSRPKDFDLFFGGGSLFGHFSDSSDTFFFVCLLVTFRSLFLTLLSLFFVTLLPDSFCRTPFAAG